jgi:hypothetical protein
LAPPPALDHLLDELRMAVVATGFDVVAELGRDRDLVADGRERFSDEIFVRVWAVHFGGVASIEIP